MSIPRVRPYAMPRADELPPNTADWAVDAGRAVLLIHDMQRYFLDFFPGNRPPVTDLVENIAMLRRTCTSRGVPVAYTAQPGAMSDEQRGLLREMWGRGMSADPGHREIVEALAPRAADRIFTKWRYSAFFRTGLREFLAAQGRDQLIVCGVYAHVGCLVTACDAFTNDIEAFLVADAIADFSSEYHRMALRYAAERCAMIPTTAAVLTAIAGSGRVARPRPPSR